MITGLILNINLSNFLDRRSTGNRTIMHLVVLSALLLCAAEAIHTSDFYTAAVLEHVKIDNSKNRQDGVQRNLDVFESAAAESSSLGADIIVYPEDAILPSSLPARGLMSEFYEAIPDPRKIPPWTPCQHPNVTDFPVLTRLSCIARDYRIYVVANLGGKEPCIPQNDTRCPTDVQLLFYNTNVVFDTNGTLIARHRKRFPFFEANISRPRAPEYTVFNTSFGSFAVIICYDTVFGEAVEVVEKFGVENVIISTFWFDELPYFSALGFFQGWALGNRVNVLAANSHRPSTGTTGSLIASGVQGSLVYTFNKNTNTSELLLARVPRTLSYTGSVKVTATKSLAGYEHKNADMRNYTFTKLENLSGTVESCNNGLCCHLNYTANKKPENFYLTAFNGIRNDKDYYFLCQEVCALVLCTRGTNCTTFPTHSDESFQSLSLSGNIQTPHQYPSVMATGMTPVPHAKWNFSLGHLSVRGVQEPLLSVNLHGRCYDRDPPFPDT